MGFYVDIDEVVAEEAFVVLAYLGNGTPGEPVYIARRDTEGTSLVRDTSEGTLLWPAERFPPATVEPGTSFAGYTAAAGTGGAGTLSRILFGTVETVRFTWSTGTTTKGGLINIGQGAGTGATVTPGERLHAGVTVRSSRAQQVQLEVVYTNGSGSTVSGGGVIRSAVAIPANTRVEVLGEIIAVPANAAAAMLRVSVPNVAAAALWQAGDWLEVSEPWVRPPVDLVVDHEARQGVPTEYLLLDTAGVNVRAVSQTWSLPRWGTWLKSPGHPDRNTRVHYAGSTGATRPARRAVFDVEGSELAVVLSELRGTSRGAVRLLTLTAADERRVIDLLADGGTLMLDTDPDWGVPFRYVSVGDYTIERAYEFDGLNLTAAARLHVLDAVMTVDAPTGVTVAG